MTSNIRLPDSLFNAFLFNGGSADNIINKELASFPPEDGKVWVHLNNSNSEDVIWLSQSSGLDPLKIEALLAEETRPRTSAMAGGLLVTLCGVNLNKPSDFEDIISIRIWVDESRIITCRKRNLISVDDLINQFNNNQGPLDCAEFLVELVNRII